MGLHLIDLRPIGFLHRHPFVAVAAAALTLYVQETLSHNFQVDALKTDYFACRSHCFSIFSHEKCDLICEASFQPNEKWEALFKTEELSLEQRAQLAGFRACLHSCVTSFNGDAAKMKQCSDRC